MSAIGWVAATVVGFFWLVMLAGMSLHRSAYRKPRRASFEPAPPTLSDVYASAMGHWDKQFYAALDAALPGVCLCNPYPYMCPIHQSPPEKIRDLRGIRRHHEANQDRVKRRPELSPRYSSGGVTICTCETVWIEDLALCEPPRDPAPSIRRDPDCPAHSRHARRTA